MSTTPLYIAGFVQSFTDNAGVLHDNCFWVPATVTMDNADKNGSIQWYGYDSATTYTAGDQPVQGAVHMTTLNNANYAKIVNDPVAPSQSYGYATAQEFLWAGQAVLDTWTGANDTNGNPIMGAFFANATTSIVEMPVK
jgi:hypothetical protein